MDLNNLQRNFEGYLNTPLLWCEDDLYGLEPYILRNSSPEPFEEHLGHHLRLGKMVERFVFHQLADDLSCTMLAENIQIQDGKRTIGELDALLITETGPVHLEIIYKFYLYDPDEGDTEISHWIGPNRNDALVQKLSKLKEKQLPLLYHPKTQPLLERLDLNLAEIKQEVLFKAQLFLPLDFKDAVFHKLNPACLIGFYIKKAQLHRFKNAQFFIPEKRDWIMNSHENIAWLDAVDFTTEVTTWLDKKRSPLCWVKEGESIQKFFVVWW